MKWFLSIACLWISFSLTASVEEHLKKIEDKSGHHQMRNIDFIYMINLDQRPEKFQKSQDQFDPHLIYPYRFSAVNGWELSLEAINDLGVKYQSGMRRGIMCTCYLLDGNFEPHHEMGQRIGQAYFCHCMSRGAIGIVLSHLSVLQDAYDSGYETIWVMEDDIEIVQNPHTISNLVEELDRTVGKGGWDILFTDRESRNNNGTPSTCDSYAKRINMSSRKTHVVKNKISPTFRVIEARYGAYSMIIRRSGMKKILDFYKRYDVYLPYDMDMFIIPKLRFFTVLRDVVTTRIGAESDNGGPNYLNRP